MVRGRSAESRRTGRGEGVILVFPYPNPRWRIANSSGAKSPPKRKDVVMEKIISNLVSQFEKGALSRRQLVRGLAMLAATGTVASAAQNDIDFKTADIDHVSIQVTDLQRSVDFYKKMFDFSVVSEDKPLGIVRLGTNRTLVSLNRQSPPKIVDHFAIGVPRFSKEAAARYVKQRGATPEDDPYAGLHIKDPDGINVQIFYQRRLG